MIYIPKLRPVSHVAQGIPKRELEYNTTVNIGWPISFPSACLSAFANDAYIAIIQPNERPLAMTGIRAVLGR